MPVFQLPEEIIFPPPDQAEPSGLLAVGGDLSPERLALAYRYGIFPWYQEEPILWWSPDPRMVLPVDELKIPRSTRRYLKKGTYRVSFDEAFSQVVQRCADVDRSDDAGTWITERMVDGYCQLHKRGEAHSVEVWEGEELVGGLYGVSVGSVFCGESMFAIAPDASKVGFVTLVQKLEAWGFKLVDCQIYTDHLARFGAKEVPRRVFIEQLKLLSDQSVSADSWG